MVLLLQSYSGNFDPPYPVQTALTSPCFGLRWLNLKHPFTVNL